MNAAARVVSGTRKFDHGLGQILVNCHCQLDENPVGYVETVQLVVQYLTQAVIKLPSAGDNTRSSVQRPL